jgi:hypothetical protein
MMALGTHYEPVLQKAKAEVTDHISADWLVNLLTQRDSAPNLRHRVLGIAVSNLIEPSRREIGSASRRSRRR